MIINNTNNHNNFKIISNYLNILYIEDEENIRENITKTLEMMVSNVFPVENIKQAKEVLSTQRIDLIISDINLPDVSGIEFVKELRKNNFLVPVILLSAYTDKDYLLEATKLKLVDYLVKPMDFNVLKTALINASDEIIKNAKFIVEFEDDIVYNVMEKSLYNKQNKNSIDLTGKELMLLEYFIENHKRVISHEEIKSHIWEDSFDATDSALKNVLNKVRKKIGKNVIKNISGIGFKLNVH